MKAKLYTLGQEMELRIGNKSYASNEGEDKKAFLKRAKVELEKDFDEVVYIVEISNENLQKLDDNMLVEAYKNSKGLQERILQEILKSRNIEVEKIEKVTRAKIKPLTKEEAMATEEYKTAKSNVGKLARYTPNGSEDVVEGIVKSISFNKTNTIIYYNVLHGTNLRCATSKNETLEFFEF